MRFLLGQVHLTLFSTTMLFKYSNLQHFCLVCGNFQVQFRVNGFECLHFTHAKVLSGMSKRDLSAGLIAGNKYISDVNSGERVYFFLPKRCAPRLPQKGSKFVQGEDQKRSPNYLVIISHQYRANSLEGENQKKVFSISKNLFLQSQKYTSVTLQNPKYAFCTEYFTRMVFRNPDHFSHWPLSLRTSDQSPLLRSNLC